jgi:hypothetical protein
MARTNASSAWPAPASKVRVDKSLGGIACSQELGIPYDRRRLSVEFGPPLTEEGVRRALEVGVHGGVAVLHRDCVGRKVLRLCCVGRTPERCHDVTALREQILGFLAALVRVGIEDAKLEMPSAVYSRCHFAMLPMPSAETTAIPSCRTLRPRARRNSGRARASVGPSTSTQRLAKRRECVVTTTCRPGAASRSSRLASHCCARG